MIFKPALFGVKPECVLKGGFIVGPTWVIRTPRSRRRSPRSIARSSAPPARRLTTSLWCHLEGRDHRRPARKLGLDATLEAVKTRRKVGKKNMVLNDAMPKIEVDPETYTVKADGVLLTCEPAKVLPMAQRYFMY